MLDVARCKLELLIIGSYKTKMDIVINITIYNISLNNLKLGEIVNQGNYMCTSRLNNPVQYTHV